MTGEPGKPEGSGRESSLLAVRARVLGCTACGLRAGCRSPVPWHGPAPNRIAVVGEAPGENEDARGIPFCGRAGKLLDNLWRISGLPVPSLMNVVCCRPPENRTPTTEEIAACTPNLQAQLYNAVDPLFVILLGEVALRTFRGPTAKIVEWRGRPWWKNQVKYMATYHPAYALRAPEAAKLIASDLGTMKGVVGGWWPEVCDCGEAATEYTEEGIPKCSTGCQGRVCVYEGRPAEWRVKVDGRVMLMCRKHKNHLEVMKGVEVIGVA